MFKLYIFFILCLNISYLGNALECYVCHNQEGNEEKCLKTINQCQPEEDVCATEIKWGSTPYWSQGSKKQFYVSKECSTKKKCERTRMANMLYCTHVWYEDWKCSECCQGDRCNYYVISGADKSKLSTAVVIFLNLIVFSITKNIF